MVPKIKSWKRIRFEIYNDICHLVYISISFLLHQVLIEIIELIKASHCFTKELESKQRKMGEKFRTTY